jgi:hypothetical protein
MVPALVGPVEPVKQLFEAVVAGEAFAPPLPQAQGEGEAERFAAEIDALEADHNGNMVGQFLDEGATLVLATNGG